ncbi:MAG: twin-arginine translocase subunit TatC [Alistipes sp.]|nr:twin-arginine translocase subunit TatC [Alistipes sp.]
MSKEIVHDEAEMTFGEHLDELRKILMRVILIFGVLFCVLFALKGIVMDVVLAPVLESFPTNRLFNWMADMMGSDALRISPDNVDLYNTKMAGQFLLHIKSSLVGAFVIAFPYLIWELWLFVKPALPPQQRKKSFRYVLETPVWFLLGLFFGYFIIAPLAINFLGNYQVSEQINNIIGVDSFMNTVISVSFAAAIAFQLPLLIRLLATMGIVTSEGMRQYRKVAVAALLIFAAIITPPDVVSQVLIFIPCYFLYEYGITIAVRIEQARAKEEAEYEAMIAAEKAKAEAEEAARKAEEEAADEEGADEKGADEESQEESSSDEDNTSTPDANDGEQTAQADEESVATEPEEKAAEESENTETANEEEEEEEEELEEVISPLGSAMMPKFPQQVGVVPKKRKIVYSVATEEPQIDDDANADNADADAGNTDAESNKA